MLFVVSFLGVNKKGILDYFLKFYITSPRALP